MHSEEFDQTGRMLGAQSFCWFCHEPAHISNSPAAVTSGLNDLQNHDGYRGYATAGEFADIYMLSNYFYIICSWAATAFISILQKQKNIVFRFLEHLLYYYYYIFLLVINLQYKNLNRISDMTSSGDAFQ